MIDVNGSRYHLYLGPNDWGRTHRLADESATAKNDGLSCYYDPERHVVTLTPLLFTFPINAKEPSLVVNHDRRGATRDRYGHWYWIDADGVSLRVRWSQAHVAETYWSSADTPSCQPTQTGNSPFQPVVAASPDGPARLAGLAATTGHYLVAGLPDANALLVFDLHTGGAPQQISLPPPPLPPTGTATESARYDLAPLANGGVAVLDRIHRVVWLLDAALRPEVLSAVIAGEPLLFQPQSGTRMTSATYTAQSIQLTDTIDPVSVEPLPDGSVLILDRAHAEFATVRRYLPGSTTAVASVPLQEAALIPQGSTSLALSPIQGYDMAFLPATTEQGNVPDTMMAGKLYVVNDAGNQAVALSLSCEDPPESALTLRVEQAYYPLRGFTGKALVAPPASAHVYFDQGDQWMPLAVLPRKRYVPREWIELPPLDGKEPGCIWHRLCLDACIPPHTAVRVQSRAADTEEELQWQSWQDEPIPYLRHTGSEAPYTAYWREAELQIAHTGTWELLFQQARGRHLALRLLLIGDGRSSPKLRALRAHYPRFSYRDNYLPALYQQDGASAAFIESFLANPEGLLTQWEGLIANSQALLDVRTVPADAVEWLAGWLGLILDPAWSDYQRRLLLANAPYFFLRRGTLPGLYQIILLALCPEIGPAIFEDGPLLTGPPHRSTIRVVERFRLRGQRAVALGDPTAGSDSAAESADVTAHAHNFTVLLPSTVGASAIALIDRLVAWEKPAHTTYTIKQYWALFRVGEVRLGLDTILGEGGRFTWIQLGETALAEGTLATAYPYSLTDRTVLAD